MPIKKTNLEDLDLKRRGKVRDIYKAEHDKLLLVTTDRLSAFDCIIPDPIPKKGKILTKVSAFWFKYLKENFGLNHHLITTKISEMPEVVQKYEEQLEGRTMLVKEAKMIPIECVVRGYLAGSAWRSYQKTGGICGGYLPKNLQRGEKLDRPIFTPATKAKTGHDENISFGKVKEKVGEKLATRLMDESIRVYKQASRYAEQKDLVILDTKFEWGLIEGEITLIDEVLTPDCSRYAIKDEHQAGRPHYPLDKEFTRRYLNSLNWNKEAPAPSLPEETIRKTTQRYERLAALLGVNI